MEKFITILLMVSATSILVEISSHPLPTSWIMANTVIMSVIGSAKDTIRMVRTTGTSSPCRTRVTNKTAEHISSAIRGTTRRSPRRFVHTTDTPSDQSATITIISYIRMMVII